MAKVIVIAGPTASGKTALSLAVAERFGGEIVSADSMQLYRGMDIGTAKATPAEQARAPHHMIDIISPAEDYSVARYVEDAARCCEDILARGKVPVITGGTGLYIDSLLSGRDFSAAEEHSPVRAELDADYAALGGEAMLERLRAVDPDRAAKLNPGDRRRIVRALEVYLLTGETITAHDEASKLLPPRYEAAKILLSCKDRAYLYERINRRVDDMVREGLFEEVAALLAGGLSPECTAMQAIGYKEPARALSGELSREEAIELIKLGSRRYAKRQLTWFNRTEDALRIAWDNPPDLAAGLRSAEEYLIREGFVPVNHTP